MKQRRQPCPMKDVITQHQRHRLLAAELAADNEGLRQSLRFRLDGILDAEPPLISIAQQPDKVGAVFRRRNHEDFPDARQHERGQRVIDHRLIVNGQQLLADHLGQWVQPRARAACENDASHCRTSAATAARPSRSPRYVPAPFGPSPCSMYHLTVFASPDAKFSCGCHPSALRIFVASIA